MIAEFQSIVLKNSKRTGNKAKKSRQISTKRGERWRQNTTNELIQSSPLSRSINFFLILN